MTRRNPKSPEAGFYAPETKATIPIRKERRRSRDAPGENVLKILPDDVRNMIYKLCKPAPRVIEIYNSSLGSWESLARRAIPVYLPSNLYEYHSTQVARCKVVTVPVLLHINHESRAYSLRFYTVIFTDPIRGQPVYFDLRRDVLEIQGMEAAFVLLGRVPSFTSEQYEFAKGGDMTTAMMKVRNLSVASGACPDQLLTEPFSGLKEFTNTEYLQTLYLHCRFKTEYDLHCRYSKPRDNLTVKDWDQLYKDKKPKMKFLVTKAPKSMYVFVQAKR
ncbi:uncharacterized protein EAF02_002408 [Botrytis sinoallii]|uniref:uncharacterized protein n=1 Tax=Botrytis sinoallii TaxID=1463999 RepID=UPI001902144A|nr:uncharacterized protein EAF02_002408 [Botrytis sinoallii]KAF7889993.1 hypothetical protein EAF02_002408 [Botrytis sinoallii]